MKLIFVYNATSGKAQALWDTAHKIISPKNYSCNLCSITFGAFTEKKIWKDFRENSKTEMIFLHRDEFQKQYKSKWLQKFDFPVILVTRNEGLEVFISSEELKELKTPESLIELIRERLNRN